ncbi:hypothetical protein PGTUg99_013452 [Puccinia graminis f. sp. tritici]|uniref:Uncharacterized protein n=1 Tax=Puccinia graminis f. sp. tritici TaxID=56615 RepID=A0A5B0NSI6_PUCGR|nr:hypothetical protein PGTUg99_013452 [Puccinia graminis f. sp. tritici]
MGLINLKPIAPIVAFSTSISLSSSPNHRASPKRLIALHQNSISRNFDDRSIAHQLSQKEHLIDFGYVVCPFPIRPIRFNLRLVATAP